MAILEILHYPDPILRTAAEAVEAVDDEVRTLIDNMLETMYDAPGIGLAAIQVGVPLRVITIDISENRNEPLCLINPKILSAQGCKESEEGCLSVPDYYDQVTRAEKIQVTALDRNGDTLDMEAEGLLAVCIQHEIDHLDGKLFVDYLSHLKRQRLRKRFKKQSKAA